MKSSEPRLNGAGAMNGTAIVTVQARRRSRPPAASAFEIIPILPEFPDILKHLRSNHGKLQFTNKKTAYERKYTFYTTIAEGKEKSLRSNVSPDVKSVESRKRLENIRTTV